MHLQLLAEIDTRNLLQQFLLESFIQQLPSTIFIIILFLKQDVSMNVS